MNKRLTCNGDSKGPNLRVISVFDRRRKLAMNNTPVSRMKIQPSRLIPFWPAGLWAAWFVLLTAPLVSAQTACAPPLLGQPWPAAEQVTSGGAADAPLPPSGYVDGGSSCLFRTGDRSCSIFRGPFRQVGEGEIGVAPGGTLTIKGGLYSEAVFLNRNMTIMAENGAVTISPPSLAAFDLGGDALDANGLLLNPKWGAQRRDPPTLPNPLACPAGRGMDHDPGSPPCSNQFTYLNGALVCGPHINWFGATYEGSILWADHSCGDDDYDLDLIRSDQAGYTTTLPYIRIEFDSDETIDHFNSPWWSRFHQAVDDDGCGQHGPRALEMMGGDDGRFGIVTALMGIDHEHTAHVELHPAWALAMNVQPSVDDDLWVFFVRNWGDEGFCSSDPEFIYFPNNRYTVRLPWRLGATSVGVTSQTWHPYHTQTPAPSVSSVPGQGVFVTFNLDAPRDDGSMWDGELHLSWQ